MAKKKEFPPKTSAPFCVDEYAIPIDIDLSKIEFLFVDDPAFFIVCASD